MLDEIVQNRRNTKAAKGLLERLLKKQGLAPKSMITDKLRSYCRLKSGIPPICVLTDLTRHHRSSTIRGSRESDRLRDKSLKGFQGFRTNVVLDAFCINSCRLNTDTNSA